MKASPTDDSKIIDQGPDDTWTQMTLKRQGMGERWLSATEGTQSCRAHTVLRKPGSKILLHLSAGVLRVWSHKALAAHDLSLPSLRRCIKRV